MGKKQYDDDDGRVIADMNVEGMPWNNGYSGYNRWVGGFINKKYKKDLNQEMPDVQQGPEEEMTRKETFVVVFNAVLATLLIAGVFLLVIFLFLLFCTNVWFK